jgi:hypothetical protein
VKSYVVLLILVLLLTSALVGCAAGPNPQTGTATEHHGTAGFWLGIWHGFIAPFVFFVSLFKSGLNIYEVHNNGAWYNLGYLFGLTCFLGGGGSKTRRKQPRPQSAA